jgi:hypothetical protein
MIVDDDDFVSGRIVQYVSENPDLMDNQPRLYLG